MCLSNIKTSIVWELPYDCLDVILISKVREDYNERWAENVMYCIAFNGLDIGTTVPDMLTTPTHTGQVPRADTYVIEHLFCHSHAGISEPSSSLTNASFSQSVLHSSIHPSIRCVASHSSIAICARKSPTLWFDAGWISVSKAHWLDFIRKVGIYIELKNNTKK